MRLVTLGDSAVVTAEGRLDAASPTLFLATCYVAVPAGRRVTRETLLDLFWPGDEDAARRPRLRALLHRLKKLGIPIDVTPTDVTIPPGAVEADYYDVRSPLAILSNPALIEHVASILPFDAPVPRALEEWMDGWRQDIGREITRGVVGALQIARDRGDWRTVEMLAERCRVVDPFNEEAHLALAEALCMTGSKERALKLLDQYVAELGDERRLRVPVRMLRERLAAADDRPAASAEVPFVGRADLRRAIVEAFTQSSRGRGGARVIWGPAGIGKSRLLREVQREIRLRGGAETGVTCEPGDRVRPLSALFDLIPKLLELPGAIGCDPRVLAELRALDSARDEAASAGEGATPPARRLRTQSALLELLDAIASEQPLAIAIDDAQWMDPGLRPYWDTILEWSRAHPVLWLFTCRAESVDDVARLGLGEHASLLHVSLLDEESSKMLVGKMSATLPPAVQSQLAQLGSGNPLVISELVRHYEETGGAETLPGSITTLIGERLDRLSRTGVRVLQAAAILGAHATVERLEAMLALPRQDFTDAVYELASAGIIAEDAEARLRAHALWSEAAMGRLQPVVASMLHRHAAERLDMELMSNPRAAILWESGRHWLAAGDKARTLSALTRGADHLAASGYPFDAALVYRRAVELSSDAVERLKLMKREIELLQVSGRWPDVIATIDEHERLAADVDPAHDPHNQLELGRHVAQIYLTGDIASASRAALACARDPRATGEHRLWAAKQCINFAEYMGYTEEMIAAEAIAREIPVTSVEDARALALVKALYHMRVGDPEQAAAIARERIEQERQVGNAQQLCRSLIAFHASILHSGAIDEARARAREVVSIASKHGLTEALKAGYDLMIVMALEFEDQSVARHWIARARQLVDEQPIDDRMYRTVYVPMYEAQLAIAEGDGVAARAVAPPLETVLPLPVPRWRTRFVAVHLGIALLTGDDEGAHALAARMSDSFERPDRWLDWPAYMYATYLSRYRGREAAAAFALRFVQEIRLEHYPPQRQLLALVGEDGTNAKRDVRRGGVPLAETA